MAFQKAMYASGVQTWLLASLPHVVGSQVWWDWKRSELSSFPSWQLKPTIASFRPGWNPISHEKYATIATTYDQWHFLPLWIADSRAFDNRSLKSPKATRLRRQNIRASRQCLYLCCMNYISNLEDQRECPNAWFASIGQYIFHIFRCFPHVDTSFGGPRASKEILHLETRFQDQEPWRQELLQVSKSKTTGSCRSLPVPLWQRIVIDHFPDAKMKWEYQELREHEGGVIFLV